MAGPRAVEPAWLSWLARRSLYRAAVFAMVAVAVAANLGKTASPDMAFLLYAARKVLDGGTLYRDVVEINPPLIVWLNLPAAFLARVTHLSEFLVYRLVSAAVVGTLFLVCYRLVRRHVLPDDPTLGRYLLLLICFALFPFSGDDFGQREHFVLALVIPYLLLVAARVRRRAIPSGAAAWIGVLLGIALALKPHFLLAWVALEVFLRVRSAADRWRPTPELFGTMATLAAYAVAVVAITPQYLMVAALLGPPYTRYLREPLASLFLLAPGAPLVLFALLAFVVLRRHARAPDLQALLATAAAACYLAGVAQQKGLHYHFYPASALAFVLLGLVAVDAPRAATRLSERLYARVARVLAATMVLVMLGTAVLDAAGGGPGDRRAQAEFDDLVTFVRAHAGGRPVGILSYHIGAAFPLLGYAGVPLASRFPHLWIFPASYWDSLKAGGTLRYHAVAEMEAPERYMWDAVREDLLAAQPRLILILRPARDVARNGLRRLHYVRYFGRDPDLAALFSRYQLVAEKGEYQLYERVDERARRMAPPPSADPAELDVKLSQVHEVRVQILDPPFLAGLTVFTAMWGLSLILDRRRAAVADAAATR